MNLKLFFTLLFCALSIFAIAQTPNRDVIARDKIVILNSTGNKYTLGQARQLYSAFGRTKRVKNNNEMIEHQGYTYTYDGLKIYFNGADWDGAAIDGKNYKLSLAGQVYAIGDDIKKVENQFPLSFKNRYKIDPKNGAVWVYIENADAYIVFKYDLNRQIKQIWLGYDNS